MKPIASLLAGATLATTITFGASAAAQERAPHPQMAQRSPRATTTTIKTAEYTELNTAGDQVVTFGGDELSGPVGGAYGDIIRRPPGIMRAGLIRPRLNFVSELLKSVENL
jgi:hypothetical protein